MLSSQEIKELEKEWLKYKIKKHSKKAVFTLSIVGLTASGYYFYQSGKISSNLSLIKEKFAQKVTNSNTTDKTEKKAEKKVTKKEQKIKKEEKPLLALDTKFLENIEKRLEKEAKEKKHLFAKPKKEIAFKKSEKKFSITKEEKEEKKKIKIVSKQINTLTFLKKKFEATKEIKYALMVASYYYEKKDYKNALKWAIKANEIDSSNEESWIIFAKSKLKLGRKKEAINALKLYLKNRNSQNVLNVLQQIKRGHLNG